MRWLTFRDGDPIDATVCDTLLRKAVRVARMSRSERYARALDREDPPDSRRRRGNPQA